MLPYRNFIVSVFSSVSRFYEVVAGIALGLFSLLFAALTVFVPIRTLQHGTFDITVVAFVSLLLVLATGGGITAFRLVSGRGRSMDGGLFPPWFLRILGLAFLAALVWFAVPNGVAVTLIERLVVIVMALILGVGCFYLANRQRRATQEFEMSGNDT